MDRERLTYMVEAVAELPERLRIVVEQYFLAERPMAEIAAELGVTESRVSQIRAEALVLLRGAMDRALEPELGRRDRQEHRLRRPSSRVLLLRRGGPSRLRRRASPAYRGPGRNCLRKASANLSGGFRPGR